MASTVAATPITDTKSSPRGRIDWVDTAKGICIILVVMMHAVAGYQIAVDATGWMQPVLDFAKTFRMPDFFLLSALLLYARIDAPWKLYIDRKVVHFAYFYVLWMVIQVGIKEGMDGTAPAEILSLMAVSLVQPFGTLWFIYMLVVFFLVTRLLRGLPVLPVWIAAAALQVAPIDTGLLLVDNFASYFVFFYTGFVASAHLFRLAEVSNEHKVLAASAMVAWALTNGVLVSSGWAALPGMGLVLGLAGCGAIVVFSALIASSLPGRALAVAGANSIAIYLAFFLPMAVTRIVLAKTGLVPDVGLASFIVMAVAVIAPLVLLFLIRNTPLNFIFERPGWARIVPAGSPRKTSQGAMAPVAPQLPANG